MKRLLPFIGIALSVMVGAAGCGGDERTASEVGGARGEGAPLRGRVLTDTLTLGLPEAVLEIDGRLVVQDRRTVRTVHVFDSTGHHLASAGSEGAGPGEFVEPLDAFVRGGHPEEFWLFDQRLGRLTAYDPSSFVPGSEPRPSRPLVTLSPAILLESPRWLDDSTLVALDPMMSGGDGRFALFGADGLRERTVGAPPPGSSRIRPFIRQQAYGGYIAVHPRSPRFALASRYAGRLEVYDRDGKLRARMQVPEPFEPDYRPARDGLNMLRGPEFRFGYVDVTATESHVFGLFSGRRFKGGRNDDSHLADRVHVFGWDGRFLGEVRLEEPALRAAVGPDGRHLYALRHDPHPQVVRYDLSGVDFRRIAAR